MASTKLTKNSRCMVLFSSSVLLFLILLNLYRTQKRFVQTFEFLAAKTQLNKS